MAKHRNLSATEENQRRSNQASIALETYAEIDGADEDCVLRDFLADLMHHCDRNGIDFEYELDIAIGHYRAEKAEEKAYA